MRIVLYIASLLAGSIGLQYVLVGLAIWAVMDGRGGSDPLSTVLRGGLVVIAYALPFGLLIGRGYIWFKQRRMTVPASYGWFSYALSCLVAGALLLTVAGYAVMMLMGEGTGLSGIPLGLVLLWSGLALSLTMPIVEWRDWRAYRRGLAQPG